MPARKSSHGTIFLIVSSGSPLALIASSLRSTSKKPFCPMTRSLHPPMTACGHRVRFARTWREGFFEVPGGYFSFSHALKPGSLAIDLVPQDKCTPRDQRAVTRPIDGDGDGKLKCDAGAFEFKP